MKNFSEWFHNILEEAEIIDSRYPIKGMSVWLPRGFQIRKNMVDIIKKLLDNDHDEVLFPLLIPESELAKEAIHVKGFEEEVYWITKGGKTELNEKLALRPTSETSMYPMFSLWVRSHTDLPQKYYQLVNTFRYETKHTRPLIRVREITTFIEAHTLHKTEKEADKQVEIGVSIFKELFDTLGIPYTITKRPEWDKFPGSSYTIAFDTIFPDGKTLQIGTVHNLGTTFAKTYNIQYENEEGTHEYAHQTCYGISDRVIASIIGIHGDETGLKLTSEIAPKQVVIVPIIFKEKEEIVLNFCDNLQEKLENANIQVMQDKRDIRPGKKYYEWEMKGVPLRIEVGPRDIENNKVVLIRRDNKEKQFIDYNQETIINTIHETLNSIDNNMKEEAWSKQENKINHAENIKQLTKTINKKGGIVTFNWCGNNDCGKDIEEKFNVDVLGILTKTDKDLTDCECIHCQKPAKHIALISKTY